MRCDDPVSGRDDGRNRSSLSSSRGDLRGVYPARSTRPTGPLGRGTRRRRRTATTRRSSAIVSDVCACPNPLSAPSSFATALVSRVWCFGVNAVTTAEHSRLFAQTHVAYVYRHRNSP